MGDREPSSAGPLWPAIAPNAVFAFTPEPTETVPLLAGKGLLDGQPAAYVCESFACRQPVTAVGELQALLAR